MQLTGGPAATSGYFPGLRKICCRRKASQWVKDPNRCAGSTTNRVRLFSPLTHPCGRVARVQVGPEDAVRVVTEWNFASGSHALTVAHPDLLMVSRRRSRRSSPRLRARERITELARLCAPRIGYLGGHFLQPVGTQHTLERCGVYTRERIELR